jgi:hypothetical protein
VVVTTQDIPVEIQVRTWRQDQWAQIVETLGDKWGRGIRYGDGPNDPDTAAFLTGGPSRSDIWRGVLALGDLVALTEKEEHLDHERESLIGDIAAIDASHPDLGRLRDEVEAHKLRMIEDESDLRDLLSLYATLADALP